MKLPHIFLEQAQARLGPDFDTFLSSFQEQPTRAARFRYKVPSDLEPVPWEPSACYISFDSGLGQSIEHEAGGFYIQEPSAMMPARLLSPKPGDKVLDLCAAPGGKATQLAQMMNNTGVLICNEPIPSRARTLSSNIERMGVSHAIVTQSYPDTLAKNFPEFFDKILVDAPCSGEGMFRKNPEAVKQWSPDSPNMCAKRQGEILASTAKMLRPGGRLVYSTCTFNQTENEDVIDDFVLRHPAFSTINISLGPLSTRNGCIRMYPHKVKGEGHFACLLEKSQRSNFSSDIKELVSKKQSKNARPQNRTKEIPKEIEHLLKENYVDGEIQLFQENYVVSPLELDLFDGIKILRFGLHLGKYKGNTFIPDHALSKALTTTTMPSIPLIKEEAVRYLCGEELSSPSKNTTNTQFFIVSYQGLPLGWAKAVHGRLKNHYPKGLRKTLII